MMQRGGVAGTWSKLAVALVVMAAMYGCAHPIGTATMDLERLLNAIARDDAGYVRGLVANGKATVDQKVPAPGYPDGTPLVTIAARNGAVDVLRYLLSAGADPNAPTPVGETALMLAAFFPNDEREEPVRERYEQAVRLLLDAGANVENRPHHYTALSYAAYQNRQPIIRVLIAKGARVDGEVTGGIAYVNTPLMMAAIQGHYDAALSLLRAGANPGIRVYKGHTAAELAEKNRHVRLARLLQCAQQQRAAAETLERRCS
jgi:hypothetical protein